MIRKHRSSRFFREKARRCSRMFCARGWETLEGRRLLSVTTGFDVRTRTLTVALGAAGDVAVLDGLNRDISVNGSTFTDVRAIDVQGNNNAAQVVELDGDVRPIDVSITRVSAVAVNGEWAQQTLTIALSAQPGGGISGAGAFVVGGNAKLSGGNVRDDRIVLTGANDFRGDLSLDGAADVVLNDIGVLKLKALRVQTDATLTSQGLQLTGDRNNGSYLSRTGGVLTLQPKGLDQPISIGGTTRYAPYYHLSEPDLNALRFNSVVVGRADGRNRIEIGPVRIDPHDELTLRTGGGGAVRVDGPIASRAGVTFAAPDAVVTLNAGITAGGSGLDFQGPVVVGRPKVVELDVHGAARFRGAVDDDASPSVLEVVGRNDVSFATVGAATPLGGLKIVNGDQVAFNGDASARTIDVAHAFGTITVAGALRTTARGAGSALALDSRARIVLNGSVSAPDQRVRLSASEGIAASGSIRAGHLVIEGRGASRLDSSRNRVDVLSGDVQGPLTFFDASALAIHPDPTHPFGLRSNGSIAIKALDSLLVDGSILAPSSDVVLDAPTVVESTGGFIHSAGLLVQASERAALKSRANKVAVLAAATSGSFTFRNDRDPLTIGAVAGVSGIHTLGGAVLIQNDGVVNVAAPIDTTPGAGGRLTIEGPKSKVRLDVQPTLGGGDLTFVVD